MLKRYQVLLNEWLAGHIQAICEKYDISFSEAIRLVLCLQIPKLVTMAHSKHKVAISDKNFVQTIRGASCGEVNSEKLHKLILDIYFEARKAIEFWTAEERKQKGKKEITP